MAPPLSQQDPSNPNRVTFDSTLSTKSDLRRLHSELIATDQKIVQTQKTLEGLFLTSNRLRVGVEVERGALQGVVPRVRSAVEPYTGTVVRN
ncbi:hypothetical protein YB2330_002912 [Saitoella coloradoensis]